MERIKSLLSHEKYCDYIKRIKLAERERIFCHHDMDHLFMVSRILYQWVWEYCLPFEKEMVFAVGLLHDIGRVREYEEGISHDLASAEIAKEILKDCNFSEKEIEKIADAITAHRGDGKEFLPLYSEKLSENEDSLESIKQHMKDYSLAELLYLADKASRNCSFCDSAKACKWNETKKQLSITLL